MFPVQLPTAADVVPYVGFTAEYLSRVLNSPCPMCGGKLEATGRHEVRAGFGCPACGVLIVCDASTPSVEIKSGRPGRVKTNDR